MEVRKITKEEFSTARRLCYTAFEMNIDGKRTWEESVRQSLESPVNRTQRDYLNKWAAFSESGKMLCTVSLVRFKANFDGQLVGMSGVADVSSLPEGRGTGALREVFRAALQEMFEEGNTLSYLYPFSGAYYRQYGYEYGAKVLEWRIRTDQLPKVEAPGKCVFWEDCPMEDYQRVYERYMQRYNLAVQREEIDWRNCLWRYDPYADGVFSYLYYSDAGEPLAYIIYGSEMQDEMKSLCAREFAFANIEGLMGLMSFLRSNMAFYHFVRIPLPLDMDFSLMLTELSMRRPYHSHAVFGAMGMVRVVDVRRALEQAAYRGEGEVSLKIEDAMLPQNSGVWHVRYRDGRADLVEQMPEGDCDAQMDISSFSKCLVAGVTLESLPLLRAKLYSAPEKLSGIFYPKCTLIFDRF